MQDIRNVEVLIVKFNCFSASNLPPLDACIKSPNVGSSFNRSSLVDEGLQPTGLDDSYFTTIDVDEDGDGDDAFFDVSGGSGQSPSFSPPSALLQPQPQLLPKPQTPPQSSVVIHEDVGPRIEVRSSSPELQEDEFPTYMVAPTVLANLPSSFEIRRNTQVASSLANRHVCLPLF